METQIAEKLLAGSPVSSLVIDGQGTIVFHSPAAALLLGGSPDGMAAAALEWPGQLPEALKQSMAVQLTLDPGAEIRQLKTKDEKRLVVSWKEVPLDEDRKAVYFRDVTRQVHYISKVKEQQQTEYDLFRSSHIRNGNLDEALREIALRSAETMEVKRVNIWVIGEGFNSIQSLVNYDARNGGFQENISLYRQQFPNYFALMQTEEIIPTENAQEDVKTRELLDNYIIPMGIRSLLDAPVRIEGKMAGVICFEDTEKLRSWNISELNFSAGIAQVVAQTLETHRRQLAQRNLEQALSEKKLLLAEVNHRIKNNFTLIGDLVRLQEEKAKDDFHRSIFAEIRTRLLSMTMIHRQLYMSDNIGAVSFRDFLIDLAAHFRSTFASDGIEVSTMLDNCRLPIGKAILCGLVINELMTNSCRHAFTTGQKGLVKLQLTTIGDKVEVTVSDNGRQTADTSEGVGSELVNELLSRLDAIVERNFGEGTRISLSFLAN